MSVLERIAPIFAVRNLDEASAYYVRLGFEVQAYAAGGYGYAVRDGIEIHLGMVPEDDHRSASAYVFVDDTDALAAEWRAAGAEVHGPEDTEWGRREGALIDVDGNVMRFGAPLHESTQS